MKPMHIARASVTLSNPTRVERAIPSHAVIAEKAYGIWQTAGQATGRDQEHWFEAERQLRQVEAARAQGNGGQQAAACGTQPVGACESRN
jgi:hypothetical protein